MSRIVLAFTILGLLFVGPSVTAQMGGVAPREIVINLGEFFFQVDGAARNAPINLIAGEKVKLEFTNVGLIDHEIMFGVGSLQHGYSTYLLNTTEFEVEVETEDGELEVEGFGFHEIELEPNVMVELEFTVPNTPGSFEIGCFVPGHYPAGMHAPVVVGAP